MRYTELPLAHVGLRCNRKAVPCFLARIFRFPQRLITLTLISVTFLYKVPVFRNPLTPISTHERNPLTCLPKKKNAIKTHKRSSNALFTSRVGFVPIFHFLYQREFCFEWSNLGTHYFLHYTVMVKLHLPHMYMIFVGNFKEINHPNLFYELCNTLNLGSYETYMKMYLGL